MSPLLSRLTPARQRGTEILDDPDADPALALRSLRDVALANAWFGGRRAVLGELDAVLAGLPAGAACTLLDVGTGLGDIPRAARRLGERRGLTMRTIGLERATALSRAAAAQCTLAITADALSLPFATGSLDVVTCSQVLHHFDGEAADQLLRECTRVARRAVIIGDLRRSWIAVAGLWSGSYLLGFHPVSRHDGVVSIRRGYTVPELQQLVQAATGCLPRVRRRLGFRVVARWAPHTSSTGNRA